MLSIKLDINYLKILKFFQQFYFFHFMQIIQQNSFALNIFRPFIDKMNKISSKLYICSRYIKNRALKKMCFLPEEKILKINLCLQHQVYTKSTHILSMICTDQIKQVSKDQLKKEKLVQPLFLLQYFCKQDKIKCPHSSKMIIPLDQISVVQKIFLEPRFQNLKGTCLSRLPAKNYKFKMSISRKRKYVYCIDHDFVLKPIQKDLHFPSTVTASFCKGKFQNTKNGHCSEKNSCSCLPIFNHDNNSDTNAFISSLEQKNYPKQNKVANKRSNFDNFSLRHQKTLMLFPRPTCSKTWCAVCKVPYFDYYLHISSDVHKQKIKKSKGEKYINDMVQDYKNRKIDENPNPLVTKKKSPTYTPSMEEQFEVNELGRSKKKVKTNKRQNEEIKIQIKPSTSTQPMIPSDSPLTISKIIIDPQVQLNMIANWVNQLMFLPCSPLFQPLKQFYLIQLHFAYQKCMNQIRFRQMNNKLMVPNANNCKRD